MINLFFVCLTTIILITSLVTPKVSLSENSVLLNSQEQKELNQGRVILKGEEGQYLGQVIATGKLATAWDVLTDYNNFPDFLPNIIESKIIQENSEVTIFEQTSLVDLWLLTKQFVVQIAATKTPLEKIDFKIVKGDLQNLEGTWEVKQLSPNQVLITHQVTVTPKSKSEEAIFYGIYESSLEETLQAIATEITKRSNN